MLRYAIGRLISIVPVLIAVALASFVLVRIVPGDPVRGMLGPEGTEEQAVQIRHALGLDRPLSDQFTDWVRGLAQGDLGITFSSRQKITPILIDRIPATLELALGALIVTLLLGVPIGLVAGLNKDTTLDHVLSLVALAGLSTPVFWIGTVLLIIFGLNLRWLPLGGYVPLVEDPQRNLLVLSMPAFSLGLGMVPFQARMMRASVIETLQEPFVSFARAKGLREKIVFFRYIVRHAICQVVAVLAMDTGHLLGGAILIEELFQWPGMGRLSVGAVIERDYFVMQASILVYAGLFLVINLFADLTRAWLDPRIQLK